MRAFARSRFGAALLAFALLAPALRAADADKPPATDDLTGLRRRPTLER